MLCGIILSITAQVTETSYALLCSEVKWEETICMNLICDQQFHESPHNTDNLNATEIPVPRIFTSRSSKLE